MAPRDQHDYMQRRQQIIDGALRVFARKGFEKATNKDIAQEAGIGSAGLIYHYFTDKADLFQRVLEAHAPVLHLIAQPDEFLRLPPHEALTRFASAFLRIGESHSAMAALRLMLGEVVRHPSIADMVNQIGPVRGIGLLRRYLQQEMDAGRLRRADTGAAARCFIGPLIAYLMTREILLQPDSATLTPETMVHTLVDTFLQGLSLESAPLPDAPEPEHA